MYYQPNLIRSYTINELETMRDNINNYPCRTYPFNLQEIDTEIQRRNEIKNRDDYKQISHS